MIRTLKMVVVRVLERGCAEQNSCFDAFLCLNKFSQCRKSVKRTLRRYFGMTLNAFQRKPLHSGQILSVCTLSVKTAPKGNVRIIWVVHAFSTSASCDLEEQRQQWSRHDGGTNRRLRIARRWEVRERVCKSGMSIS